MAQFSRLNWRLNFHNLHSAWSVIGNASKGLLLLQVVCCTNVWCKMLFWTFQKHLCQTAFGACCFENALWEHTIHNFVCQLLYDDIFNGSGQNSPFELYLQADNYRTQQNICKKNERKNERMNEIQFSMQAKLDDTGFFWYPIFTKSLISAVVTGILVKPSSSLCNPAAALREAEEKVCWRVMKLRYHTLSHITPSSHWAFLTHFLMSLMEWEQSLTLRSGRKLICLLGWYALMRYWRDVAYIFSFSPQYHSLRNRDNRVVTVVSVWPHS